MLLWKNKKGKKFYGRKRYCTQEEISNAIEHNPTYAKISNEIIDKIVDQVIKNVGEITFPRELKRIIVNKPNIRVIKKNQHQNALDKDYEKYGVVLSNSQIKDFNDKLTTYMLIDNNIKSEHIKYVEKVKSQIK